MKIIFQSSSITHLICSTVKITVHLHFHRHSSVVLLVSVLLLFTPVLVGGCTVRQQVNKWAATWQNQQCGCAPSEDSDQLGHLPSLIRVFAVRMKQLWVLSYPFSAQRRLWSDWADAQAALSLRWAHTHFVGFVMSRLKYTYKKKKILFFLVWFLFYVPSTHFRSFRVRSVTLITLFLGKPLRQFTST